MSRRPIDPSFNAAERYEGRWVASAAYTAHLVVAESHGRITAACGRRIDAASTYDPADLCLDGCKLCVKHATLREAPG